MSVDGVDACVDGCEEATVNTFVQVSGGVAPNVDGVDGRNGNYPHAHTHPHAHAHAGETTLKTTVNTVNRQHTPPPRISGGRAVVGGVEHVMRVAKVTRNVARRAPHLGLNPNHHIRVWCECQSQQKSAPGELPSGVYWTARPSEVVASDPRRLGGWDALGVADVRVPNSVMDIFRAHIEECADAATD